VPWSIFTRVRKPENDPEGQQRLRGARARVDITDIAHLHAAYVGSPDRHAGLEFRQRFVSTSLSESQPPTPRRDQHGANTGRQAALRQQIEQCLSFVELAAGHRYIREDGRRKCQPRRKVPFLHDLQRDARGRIRLRKSAEAKVQQSQGAVDRHQAARATRAVGSLTC